MDERGEKVNKPLTPLAIGIKPNKGRISDVQKIKENRTTIMPPYPLLSA
jgi:hypothetical protein